MNFIIFQALGRKNCSFSTQPLQDYFYTCTKINPLLLFTTQGHFDKIFRVFQDDRGAVLKLLLIP